MPIGAANTLQRVSSVAKYEPNYEEATALIQYMDTQQLQGLLDSEEKLHDLTNDLQQVKNIQVDREMLLASNKSLADYNLSKEPLLKEGREKLATLYEEVQRSKEVLLRDKEQIGKEHPGRQGDVIYKMLPTFCIGYLQVKNIQVDREMLLASNKSLADYNLSKEPLLKEGREKLATLYEEVQRSKEVLLRDKEQIDNQANSQSPDTVHALLQTEAAKSEEETEKMAEEFLDGSLSVDAFVQKFIGERTVAHLRRIKAEKMGELLQTRASGKSPYGQQWTASQTPYPNSSTGYQMPEPSGYYPR
ncbi:vacuolar protein sorting-associated protein 37B [Lingula anatina]|uniref:Vacuolar protein sorting-associated protein 37B n=1 Tax=Lingula anatina TaxID=7574 RepID=A0A1S3J0A7_LINAN|nr:vacuolar protein sorting-associated protein 37B [Lingula anatina]|eukprot:XP_013403239.1 vacuolar protein sorting-associated protein 37B [Lingula anatina]